LAVVGADDAHLSFRVLLNIQNEVLRCQTQVQFNNALGRALFLLRAAVPPPDRGPDVQGVGQNGIGRPLAGQINA
jgi:hypothetical protein